MIQFQGWSCMMKFLPIWRLDGCHALLLKVNSREMIPKRPQKIFSSQFPFLFKFDSAWRSAGQLWVFSFNSGSQYPQVEHTSVIKRPILYAFLCPNVLKNIKSFERNVKSFERNINISQQQQSIRRVWVFFLFKYWG